MSLIRSLLALLACGISLNISATCQPVSQRLLLTSETLSISDNAPPGAILKTRHYTVPHADKRGCGDDEPLSFHARIDGQQADTSMPGVFATNNPAAGLRLILTLASGQKITWPSTFRATYNEIRGARLTAEIVKMPLRPSPVHGAGALNVDIYSEGSPTPLLTISAPRTLVTRLNYSCKLEGQNNRIIYLPPATIQRFGNVGAVAGKTPFDISLSCAERLPPGSVTKITWSGDILSGMADHGVLRNTQHGPGAARGIGVQITDTQSKPVNLQQADNITAALQNSNLYKINYYARYYQHNKEISPGKLRTTLNFTIQYQ